MYRLIIWTIVAVALTFSIVALSNIKSLSAQTLNSQISISVGFVKSKSPFHMPGQYDAKTLGIGAAYDFCPTGGCQFQLSDGQISNLLGSNQLSFTGVLKVKKGGISKLYNFNNFLTISQIQNIDGKKVQTVDGTLDFGSDPVNPEFSYKVTQGTFTLEGKKATLVLTGDSAEDVDTIQSTETTETIIPETPSQQSESLQPSNTNAVSNIEYENPDYKIKILHPSNWKVNENQLPAHTIVMFKSPVSGNNMGIR